MKTPDDIITTARTLINTPYRHQGRTPGVGLDCIGAIVLTAYLLGLSEEILGPTNYSRDSSNSLEIGLATYCSERSRISPGAIALIKLDEIPYHCGIITDYQGGLGLLHAYENVGRVREHSLIPWWENKIYKLYHFPKVRYDS